MRPEGREYSTITQGTRAEAKGRTPGSAHAGPHAGRGGNRIHAAAFFLRMTFSGGSSGGRFSH